ncbi:MAG: DUF4956 domain-containing protein [Treponema sp.]|jgi:hypothetical protein|nr:DUF4956 domain-containing protein [Treponema sp.]
MPDFLVQFFSPDPDLVDMTLLVRCTITSLFTGALTAAAYNFRQISNRQFVITLALLPVIVQLIIMIVNGKVGTGIAVMGAFSLVRFRSVPGTAKEITSIFLAMALGLATGTGALGYALLFAVVINGFLVLFSLIGFMEIGNQARTLKILVPDDKDYAVIFADVFTEYAKTIRLERVRTVNLGSLYELQYTVILKEPSQEKAFIDQIRARNSNLEISYTRIMNDRESL